jgi:phenylalanyl-tRNA synthetase beta chain
VQERFGIEQTVYYFEINVEHLVANVRDITSVYPPSRYPDTIRDIAMLIADEVPFKTVRECIEAMRIREIEEVSIFDLYRGEHIPQGQKSVAIRLRYRSHDRTLTDEEVARLHERVINQLINEIKVTIR